MIRTKQTHEIRMIAVFVRTTNAVVNYIIQCTANYSIDSKFEAKSITDEQKFVNRDLFFSILRRTSVHTTDSPHSGPPGGRSSFEVFSFNWRCNFVKRGLSNILEKHQSPFQKILRCKNSLFVICALIARFWRYFFEPNQLTITKEKPIDSLARHLETFGS